MKKPQIFFLFGILWEFLRFTIFLYMITSLLSQTFLSSTQTILWLMLIGTGQFLIPVGYFLLFLDQKKYVAYLQILRIGKILGIFVSFFIIVKELFVDNNFLLISSVNFYGKKYLLFVFLGILFDLIFLYFLLSYKGDDDHSLDHANPIDQLPEFSETEIDNSIKDKGKDK